MLYFFQRWARLACCLLAVQFLARPACAHNAPSSFVDLHIERGSITGTVQASASDIAHDLPTAEPAMLLSPVGADKYKGAIAAALLPRLDLSVNGRDLTARVAAIDVVPERSDLRLHLTWQGTGPPAALHIHALLFPYDPRHKTYLTILQDGRVQRQAVLDAANTDIDFRPGSRQSIFSVVRQFVREGVHHIFIGPDHILFIVGLLLLGGSLKQLLKIVTAFTLAHSVTLALATLNIVNPPPRIIEPTIALSIVFVGILSLLGDGKRDPRLLLAFCFGFVHGFGFANALREMELPRAALGWSLVSFNVGVEIGQMCIVLAVAPLLALVRRRSERLAQKVVLAGSLLVIGAGMFWFVQRAFFGG